MPRLLAVNATGLRSGAERVLVRLATAVQRRGWHVTVAAPDGPFGQELTNAGIRRLPLPDLQLLRVPRAVTAALMPAQAARAAHVIRRYARDADVVLGNGPLVLPALRLARLRCPVVWFVHEIIARPSKRLAVRLCAPAISQAIAVSEASARSVRFGGFPVAVVWNGTAWPVAPSRPDPDAPPIVGEAAILTSWKGQDVLLEAIARLPTRDVIVELMGTTFPRDRQFAEEVTARAARPDLAGRVRMLGHVEDPLDRMRAWTISVQPSVEPEPAGLAVLEAMSIGVPVVATNHGGPPEVLDDAGLLVPPDDADALSQAIAKLLEDRDLRARCAAAGPKRIAGGHTLERQERGLLEVLEQVCSGQRP